MKQRFVPRCIGLCVRAKETRTRCVGMRHEALSFADTRVHLTTAAHKCAHALPVPPSCGNSSTAACARAPSGGGGGGGDGAISVQALFEQECTVISGASTAIAAASARSST